MNNPHSSQGFKLDKNEKPKREQNASNIKDTELIIARKIQAAMIPRSLPAMEGVELESLYLPCGAVGGDLFDVVQLSDEILAFVIFDVTGFGVSSALISAMAKVCFSSHIRSGLSPRAVIERVNAEIIRDISADFYLTAFVGYLDLHDNKLTYSNAGHAYPVIFRKSRNRILQLKTQGTFIGVFENGFFEEHSIFLNPGDCLILITDGIYRVFSEDLHEGRKVFEEQVQQLLSSSSPKALLSLIGDKYKAINVKNRIEDDVTVVSAEILTQSRKNQIKKQLGFMQDDPVYLQFISYFEEMDRAIAVVLSSMDMYGFPDESIRKMKITLTELLVNGIIHGNKRDFSKKVIMGHLIDKKMSVVSIMDEGEGFNPGDIPDPTLPENLVKDCGRGLFIVNHYVDKVEFNESGNRVTITKLHPLV